MDLSPFALGLVLFSALLTIVLLVRRRAYLAKSRSTRQSNSAIKDLVADLPAPFGYKCAWYAVRADDPLSVANRLNLRRIKSSTWKEGLQKAYEASVFTSPPTHGWILAVGTSLFPSSPISQAISATVEDLSRIHGQAFFFATDRITETHIWARATSGALERGYGYSGESGEILWDHGQQTKEEAAIAFDFPDEQTVMDLARRWCISPVDLPFADSTPGLGLLGKR